MQNSILAFALTLSACALAPAAFAQTPTNTFTSTYSFPPVGLASGETMQVNLVNLAANISAGQGVTPVTASCTGSVSFVNAAGSPIGDAAPFNVGSGVTQSLGLPFANSGISTTRGEIRAVVSLTVTEGHGAPPCSLTASLEVFDSSNITHVYLTNVFAPSPSPFLRLGLVSAQ